MNQKNENVMLVPAHKSYMDFILLAYIHYHFEMEHPFVCGDEAIFGI